MKTLISDNDYQKILENADEVLLKDLAAHSLIDFIKIDLLLKQEAEFPNYMGNIFNQDWDEEVTPEITNRIKKGLEEMDESELASFFKHFAYKDYIVEELMEFTGENREFVIENLS